MSGSREHRELGLLRRDREAILAQLDELSGAWDALVHAERLRGRGSRLSEGLTLIKNIN